MTRKTPRQILERCADPTLGAQEAKKERAPEAGIGLCLSGGGYRARLFHVGALCRGDATLQDLPDSPRFTINSTNMGSAVLLRFAKPYMWDYRVGQVKRPQVAPRRCPGAETPRRLKPVSRGLGFLSGSAMDGLAALWALGKLSACRNRRLSLEREKFQIWSG